MDEVSMLKAQIEDLWKYNRELTQQVNRLEGKNSFLEQQVKLLNESLFMMKSDIAELKSMHIARSVSHSLNISSIDDIRSTIINEIRKGFEMTQTMPNSLQISRFRESTPSPLDPDVLTTADLVSPEIYDKEDAVCLTDKIKKNYPGRPFSPNHDWN